jgi:hypothetical protein
MASVKTMQKFVALVADGRVREKSGRVASPTHHAPALPNDRLTHLPLR